ncbi:hypothetical protein NOX27_24320 [Enterobacter kobei]|nr:hypothetical protein [Enterobacter kobei]MCQ4359429.1 hypothetical protein [Enterobacter kobei]
MSAVLFRRWGGEAERRFVPALGRGGERRFVPALGREAERRFVPVLAVVR